VNCVEDADFDLIGRSNEFWTKEVREEEGGPGARLQICSLTQKRSKRKF
jgi:hypothetical protein